ncbi:hypothetical protein DFH09DRAFT_146342 [Mycena vulgaris]|nr:hypothetical protein DFH09DRAFT_146342 [Mycena vulgaris]
MEPFTVLPNQPPPSDGTVASLRHASLGDRFAGPLTSTPSHSMPVHAVSPAPSISPPSSPRQTTPSQIPNTEPTLCAPADDFSAPMVRRSLSPDGQETPAPPRESSVSAAPEGTSPSRPATVESDINMDTSSPSADTLREELAVLDMMETPQLDSPSNLSSPEPLPSMEDVIPSSATPSPMLSAQSQKTSPPRLTLSIPHLPTLATALQRPPGTLPQAPRIVDLFDTMSPLSPTTPSTRSPSARLRQVKSETETESVQPSPTPRTGPVLKLRSVGASSAAATRIKKRKGPPGEREPDSSSEPPSKRVRGRSEKKVPPPAVKTEKGKKKKKPIMWPTMTPEAEIHPEFLGKFIGCDKDKCDRWYHYSCLGIVPGDPRLEGTFDCPLCVAYVHFLRTRLGAPQKNVAALIARCEKTFLSPSGCTVATRSSITRTDESTTSWCCGKGMGGPKRPGSQSHHRMKPSRHSISVQLPLVLTSTTTVPSCYTKQKKAASQTPTKAEAATAQPNLNPADLTERKTMLYLVELFCYATYDT